MDGKAAAEVEGKFIKEAAEANIVHIKGHRSVGGLRASLYNAVTVQDTQYLINFMEKFMSNNS